MSTNVIILLLRDIQLEVKAHMFPILLYTTVVIYNILILNILIVIDVVLKSIIILIT